MTVQETNDRSSEVPNLIKDSDRKCGWYNFPQVIFKVPITGFLKREVSFLY